MFMPAISSMEARRVTIAPCLDRSRDPRASVVVHTISIAMGMDATRSTTAKERALVNGSFLAIARYSSAVRHSVQERTMSTNIIFRRSFCRDPKSSSPARSMAVFPKKVFFPVNSTVPSTSPLVMVDPIFGRDPRTMVTGSDSPGQGGLVHLDTALVHDAVGRHGGSGAEQHQVARNDQGGVHLLPLAVPLDRRLGLQRSLEGGDRVGSLDGLIPAERGVDELDGQQDDSVDPVGPRAPLGDLRWRS